MAVMSTVLGDGRDAMRYNATANTDGGRAGLDGGAPEGPSRLLTGTLVTVAGILCGVVVALIQYAVEPLPPVGPSSPGSPSSSASGGETPPAPLNPAAEFRRLVDFGDACYYDAVARLKRSDPVENPTGWAAENDEALNLLERAIGFYNEALELREDARVMSRVRDANMKRVLAQRRKAGR
jgi:hypothetical protein